MYHRDYQEAEPVEIAIEPTGIDILSYSGPDRSISESAIREAKILKARRYRNRRLGDFLKELNLTEGRATGIPTIQKHLKLNGSEGATIQTDEERSYFLITIPCRADMIEQNVQQNSHIEAVISEALENALKNTDFKVYTTDIEHFTQIKHRLKNLILQVYLQVWDNSQIDQAILIKALWDLVGKLFQNRELSSSELANSVQIGSLYMFKRYLLYPLITNEYVEMLYPNKPNSSKQGYRLTEKGRELFTQN